MNEISFFEIRVSEMLLFIYNQVSLDHTSGKIEEIITISFRTRGEKKRIFSFILSASDQRT